MLSVIATSQATWDFYPGPFFILIPLTVAYVVRWRAVDAHPGRLILFMAGMLFAAVAFFSPVDTLGDQVLAMHMIQHLLLLDVVPILCFLGLTKAIFRPATKRVVQVERHSPWLFAPLLGVLGYIVGMWFWHMPPLYNAAVRHSGVHVLEHVTFAVIGGVYWWHLISPVRDQRRLSGMGAVMYMSATKVFVGILGLALTFVPRAIYSVYAGQTNPWGLTAGEDQSLAGVIMATEQSIVMGIALVWLVTQAIERSNREQIRKERIEDMRAAKRASDAAAAGLTPPQELY